MKSTKKSNTAAILAACSYCALLLVTTPASSAAPSPLPPSYRAVVLSAPKPWKDVIVNGITDSGIVFGDVTNGGGENDIRGHGFIYKRGRFKIIPDPPLPPSISDLIGDRCSLLNITSDGKPTVQLQRTTWDGAWMGKGDSVWSNYKTFKGALPGLEKQGDVNSCYQSKSGVLYGECFDGSATLHLDDPDSSKIECAMWKNGKVEDFAEGHVLGLGVDRRCYLLEPSNIVHCLDNNTNVDYLPADIKQVSMSPRGWFIDAGNGDSASGSTNYIGFGRKHEIVPFLPDDATTLNEVVGTQLDQSDDDGSTPYLGKALIYLNGRVYDLNKCSRTIPKGWILTDAVMINAKHEIIALAQNHKNDDQLFVLLIPKGNRK